MTFRKTSGLDRCHVVGDAFYGHLPVWAKSHTWPAPGASIRPPDREAVMQTDRWTYNKKRSIRWSSGRSSLPRPQYEFNVVAGILMAICVLLIAVRL
jgi:hypothetical protein